MFTKSQWGEIEGVPDRDKCCRGHCRGRAWRTGGLGRNSISETTKRRRCCKPPLLVGEENKVRDETHNNNNNNSKGKTVIKIRERHNSPVPRKWKDRRSCAAKSKRLLIDDREYWFLLDLIYLLPLVLSLGLLV